MLKQTAKKNSIMKVMDGTLLTLPTPLNISSMWNAGSLLFMCLIVQLLTGITLACLYRVSMSDSFYLLFKTMELTDPVWLLRFMHMNGASLFFFCLYVHIGRGLYYGSYWMTHTWNAGASIFIMTMAAAFLGYILPINQMSFWGASVITNLFSEVPYLGPDLVKTMWGGNSVGQSTVTRFFALHYLLPFIISALVVVHVTMLHETGSSNPLGLDSSNSKLIFNNYHSSKDLAGVLVVMFLFSVLFFYKPLILGDDENFTPADPMSTPRHIQPEWYFLFAYAILRSIPNKMGGVIALLMSVSVLYLVPLLSLKKNKSSSLYPVNKMIFWMFITWVALLTWVGAKPVEYPYVLTGQLLSGLYFTYYVISPLTHSLWDARA